MPDGTTTLSKTNVPKPKDLVETDGFLAAKNSDTPPPTVQSFWHQTRLSPLEEHLVSEGLVTAPTPALVQRQPDESMVRSLLDYADENDDLLTHVAQRVLAANFYAYPFPFFIIDQVLPEELYREYLRGIPSRDVFEQHPRNGTLRLGLDGYRRLSSNHEMVGARIVRALDAVREHLIARFAILIPGVYSLFFGEKYTRRLTTLTLERLPLHLDDRAHRHSQGPHLDGPDRIFTWLLYLPEDDSQRHRGTNIFAARASTAPFDPLETYISGQPHNLDLQFSAKIPYVPNRLIAFVDPPVSFHGTSKILDDQRRMFMQEFVTMTQNSFLKVFGDVESSYHELDRRRFLRSDGKTRSLHVHQTMIISSLAHHLGSPDSHPFRHIRFVHE